jgi:hypothetical protein
MVKHGIPQARLINGHNPLTLLHNALSAGLHEQSDETCLELAQAVRVVPQRHPSTRERSKVRSLVRPPFDFLHAKQSHAPIMQTLAISCFVKVFRLGQARLLFVHFLG